MNWSALPETADEAQALLPRLKEYLQAASQVHTGLEAREAVVKQARQPRVAVLCTHGFFLKDQESQPEDHRGALPGLGDKYLAGAPGPVAAEKGAPAQAAQTDRTRQAASTSDR